MTHLNRKIGFIFLVGVTFLFSCKSPDNTLKKVFNADELITVNKIIDFYDNFVLSNTSKNLKIEDAYRQFLSKNCPLVEKSGDMSLLLPDEKEKLDFFSTLDRKALEEIYRITDTLKYYNRFKKEFVKVYQPYSFSLNTQGKYYDLLKLLAKRNEYFKEYLNSIDLAGDLSPSNYRAILHGYKNIDFSKKEERLVLIVNLLNSEKVIEFKNEKNAP